MAADAADRERQAQALAAAGMQAEQINVGGLQPPPVLGNPGAVPPSSGGAAGPGAWNNLDGGGVGGGGIMEADEMELDFAAMFDPAQEAQGESFFRFLGEVDLGGAKPPPLHSNRPRIPPHPSFETFVYVAEMLTEGSGWPMMGEVMAPLPPVKSSDGS